MDADIYFQRLPDEPLVCLAIDCGCRPAANTLVVRHHPWIEAWVLAQGRAKRLSAHDIEDATQAALLTFVETAIPWYRRRLRSAATPQSFRRFSAWVVADRFSKFVESLRRKGSRFNTSVDLALLDTHGRPLARLTIPSWNANGNPLSHLLRHEFLVAVGQLLPNLNSVERRLWRLMVARHTLVDIAAALKKPYGSVRRLRQRFTRRIRRHLGPYYPAEGDPA